MFAPDISQMYFNKILGLGDKEHNRIVREIRENRRRQRTINGGEMNLWGGIWEFYNNEL